jgi:hypothetical protein
MKSNQHEGKPYELDRRFEDGKFVHRIMLRCCECGRLGQANLQPTIAPEGVFKKFRQMGWRCDEWRPVHLCPDCHHPAKEKRMPAAPSNPVLPTPSMAQMRQIFAALEEHFDDKEGRYAGDWSDKKIGDQLNIPWAIVAKVREDAGMKMKADPEVMKLRADFTALKTMLDDLGIRLASLEKRAGRAA